MKTTLEELLAFRTVVDAGSITAASEQLGQTVSGISRALKRLEDKLDTSLLSRTTRRLSLTDEGQAFLTHARAILSAVDEAEEQLAARRRQPAGRLRINAASPFMLHVIAPMAADFRLQYPQIELELNTNDLVIDLLEEDTDVAIRIGTLRDSTLRARVLGASRLRVLASPGYLKAHGRPRNVEQLVGKHALLGFAQPESLNHWPLRGTHGDRLHIAPVLQASSGETLRRLALEGVGIVCLADFLTEDDRRRGDLVQVLVRDTVEVLQPIHAVFYRNTQLSSRISCFLDFLAARMATLPWSASHR
ncbi:LysR family transcriptional regulator [Pigmentiphaga aceris]|uniref:LysR family transcriptional regulator n=1 Tax=Pigmentiphaga aceris TaxID=1940612 RepID=A0A5C0AW00_9BURK|nr:LysR family transcriptional regulator [Pigmentiphaga aceris]QEI05794.1 LysR family transcriptional regulator [Pigmentiphaga aceris]